MKRFKKMVVAFDGSKDSLEALEAAETLAQDNDAHLTVVYVHGQPLEHAVGVGTTYRGDSYLFQAQGLLTPGAVSTNVPPIPDEQESIIVEDEIPKHVMNQAEQKLSKSNLNVSYETLTGKAVEELSKFAKDTDADLIIIGNRGISGIKKFVQGSVSQKVTNEAECAVFVVK